TGESGVGKERLAELVHRRSARAGRPFVAVDCGAVTETLLESELFGHVKGAFTGATADRVGLFEAAGGGTLFLDEVGETSLAMQAKLLRAIQEREVRRVGESVSRRVDVRVVAATNRDLAAAVAAGRFRQDLLYRLKVVEVRVPPLRERPEDLLPLARSLLASAARRTGRRLTGLTAAAAEALQRHAWPGNVRELENALERAAALAAGPRVDVADLPEEVRHPGRPAPAPGVRPLEEVEREAILAALQANGGHQGRTAAALRIGTATLHRKLKLWREMGLR
ncbi:MAG: sigma-54 dependent transcriptional regulator, partial [Anaeromyxobacteraceae bacterium]|nr:sigma-54 dependent transcriptional regulator [Anaeromyxobacteraceae bacterium]